MTSTRPREAVDEETFREALEIVVAAAHQNGVNVEGDWPHRRNGDPDWNVDIVRFVPGGRCDDS
jgi:NADPH-dependent 7-cyano-7-deazaguanine reductase QueF